MTRNKDTDYNNNNNYNNDGGGNKIERKITRLFEDFLNDVGFTRTHGSKFRDDRGARNVNWSPAIDIKEVDREYLVIADVPGVRKEDIDIEFHDSVLVLSGHLDQDIIFSTPQAQQQSQEINVGKDNVGKDNRQHQHLPQQPQYPHQQYQQQPQQYQQQQPQYQQSTEPNPNQYQQSTEPNPNQYQQSTEPNPNQYQQQPQQQSSQQQSQQQPQQQHQQLQQQPQQQHQQQQPYQQSTESQKYQQPTEAQRYQQSVDQKYNLSNEPQQQSNEYQHVKHRHQNESPRGERFHIQERPYGNFSRSIQLPSNIRSEDEFMTTLENGILKIRIPKNNDKPKRKITIK